MPIVSELSVSPQGCLPLVLMFDIKEDVDVEPQCITALMEQLDVFISIKPKPKQPSKVRHPKVSNSHTIIDSAHCEMRFTGCSILDFYLLNKHNPPNITILTREVHELLVKTA